MFQKNSIFEMTCMSLGQDAQGVCRHEDIVVFVPDLLPGERAMVRITKPERRYAYGRVEQRLTSSSERRTPFCSIYKRCGGCTCQHMSYEASLEYKRSQVEELLARIGKIQMNVPPVLGMDDPMHYRNKGMYPVGTANSQPVCGFFAQRSHEIIPLPPEGCPIQDAASAAAIRIILDWMQAHHVPAYDERSHTGLIRHIMTRQMQSGSLMIVLVAAAAKLPDLDMLISSLCSGLPQIESICLSLNAEPGNTILGKDIRVLWGKMELTDAILGLNFSVSPLSFFQVNPVQTKKLYGLALEYAALTGQETVVDAYCGTGTISLLLAARAKRVIGIEIVSAAIDNARTNAVRNHVDNAEFLLGATESILPDLIREGLQPDVIVLDPPRKGCERSVLDAIIAAQPKRIVYVSCNAPTLARDLAILAEDGYKPAHLQCVDMFCWTSSVETVVSLSREIPNDAIHMSKSHRPEDEKAAQPESD